MQTTKGRKYQDVATAELREGMSIKDRGKILLIVEENGWRTLYMPSGRRITALPGETYRVHRSTISAS